ncbi:MAG TPA: CoA-transferase, partial [Halococcus sp.]|nr:CoA-transferase [Halococcus sp.]
MASENTDREYTDRELMVSAAAAEIEDGDTAFVGMRLPLIAFQLAVSTHAPNAMAVYESGVVRDDPADGFLHTMCDLPNLNRAVSTTGMIDIMSRLQRGDVDVGFLGGAEIDRYGNLNTTRVSAGER